MKKTLFTLCTVLAIASCSKSEKIYSDSPEISVIPVTSIVPKGGPIENTTFPDEMFRVYSFYGARVDPSTSWASDLSVSTYFDWTTFKKLSSGSWAAHDNDGNTHTPKYWPKEGSLFFAGYYPKDITGTPTYDFKKPNLNIAGYTQKDYTDGTTQDDLMWFDVATSANRGPLAVTFKHALSWITVKVKAGNDASTNIFTVKNIAIGDIANTGDFTSKPTVEGENWSGWSTTAPHTGEYILYNDVTGISVSTTAVDAADGLLIIPQAIDDADVLTVKYTQDGFYESDGITLTTFTKKLVLKTAATEKWEINKHYIYTLVFGADEILLAPEVDPWTNGTSTDINIQ